MKAFRVKAKEKKYYLPAGKGQVVLDKRQVGQEVGVVGHKDDQAAR